MGLRFTTVPAFTPETNHFTPEMCPAATPVFSRQPQAVFSPPITNLAAFILLVASELTLLCF